MLYLDILDIMTDLEVKYIYIIYKYLLHEKIQSKMAVLLTSPESSGLKPITLFRFTFFKVKLCRENVFTYFNMICESFKR